MNTNYNHQQQTIDEISKLSQQLYSCYHTLELLEQHFNEPVVFDDKLAYDLAHFKKSLHNSYLSCLRVTLTAQQLLSQVQS